MLYRTMLFLRLLTERIPPGEEQRHNITWDGQRLVVCLMLGDKYYPLQLQESDLDYSARDLVGLIVDKLHEQGIVTQTP